MPVSPSISSNLTNKYNPQERKTCVSKDSDSSNLTNKYNPQERIYYRRKLCFVQILPINTILKNESDGDMEVIDGSNLTNKYNPQEQQPFTMIRQKRSNLTNKYNPQELLALLYV